MNHRFSLAAAALLLFPTVSSCSSDPDVTDSLWQVTGIYTTPDESGDLPADAAGLVEINLGESGISGYTGCTAFMGAADYRTEGHEGDEAMAADADHVSFSDLEFRSQDDDCVGGKAYIDHQLRDLLPHTFEITRRGDRELFLTVSTTEDASPVVDPPSIRLTAVQ